jgi:hypothetical protein
MGTAKTSGYLPTARALALAVFVLAVGDGAALAARRAPAAAPVVTHSAQRGVRRPPAGAPTVTSVPPTAHAASRTAASLAGNADPGATTSTTAFASQIPLKAEGFKYEITLEPVCARVGQRFTATIRLRPNTASSGTFMPIYADGSYEAGAGAFAKDDGRATYSWVAKDAPGEGRLLTQARDGETNESGTKYIAFRVVGVTESC